MPFTKRTFMGKGKTYLTVFGQNNYQRIGNTSKMTLAIEEETKELLDYENAGGGIADSVTRIKGVTAQFSIHNLNATNLAIAIFGSASAVNAGTVTNEAVTAKKGALVRLQHVSPTSVVVTDSTGSTTYNAGTDYTVTGAGLIIPDTSTINDGSTILVDYNYGAQNVIEALTTSGLEYSIVLDGINEADSGKACVVDLWRVRFSPAKAIDLIADEFGVLDLEAKLLADESQPSGKSKYFRMAFI